MIPQILNPPPREFIVATHSRLLLLRLDRQWDVVEHQVIARGYHYGVAVPTSCARHGAVRFISYRGGDSVICQTAPRIMMYERDAAGRFAAIDNLDVGPVGDVHQMTYANHGLYITDTKHNTLVYYSIEKGHQHQHIFGGVRRDSNHINSVFACGNCILVLLHNLKHKESQLAVLRHDLDTGFHVEHMLSLWHRNCHNVFCDGTELLYNASLANTLVIVSLDQDRISKRLPFDGLDGKAPGRGHAKGLSVIDGHYIIGISQEVDRRRRGTSMSYLAVIDRAAHKVVRVIDLDLPGSGGPAGNINEIRCLSGDEQAAVGRCKWADALGELSFAKTDWGRFLGLRVKGSVLGPVFRIRRRMRVGKV